MASMQATRAATDWNDLVYYDEHNRPCIDLMVNAETRQFLVQEVVCMFYHGPRPSPDSVAHVIDPSKQCTPDNVGWLSQKLSAHLTIAAELIKTETSHIKGIKRPLKRAKISVRWEQLFFVDEVGSLHLGEWYTLKQKQLLPEEHLSENSRGPWPGQESYALIIDLSKGCAPENLGWMTQTSDFRTVKYG
jgi:hypothetical protein